MHSPLYWSTSCNKTRYALTLTKMQVLPFMLWVQLCIHVVEKHSILLTGGRKMMVDDSGRDGLQSSIQKCLHP